MPRQNLSRKESENERDAKAPVIIERTFAAPVQSVWKAITELSQMKQWYFDIKEFRPEAGFEFQFTAEKDGIKYLHRCKITEVIRNKKLSYNWRYEGYEGSSLVTIELFAEGGKTRLKLTHEGLETFLPESHADFAKDNFFKGWTHIIGVSLQEFMEKSEPADNPQFVIARTFDAPRELVWKAWTVPERMAKWWGPKGLTVGKYKMDFRPGGIYHYSMHAPDGKAMWGKFVYREIVAPEKLVFVNCFSDAQGNITRHPFSPTWPLETLSAITFTRQDGKTNVTISWIPLNPTDEERKTFADGMTGMQQGWGGTLDRLQEFLAQK
jgi:uncharacterized protein YndB with AHSA1/START domain